MSRMRNWPWLKLVLALSLALNLAVAGMVAGAFLSHDERAQRVPFDRDRSLFALIAVMPPEHRDALREHLGRDRAARSAEREEQRRLRDAFLAQLRSDAPSAAQLTALLAEQRERRGSGAEMVEAAVVAEILQMPREERQAYAERLERFSRFRKDRPPPHRH